MRPSSLKVLMMVGVALFAILCVLVGFTVLGAGVGAWLIVAPGEQAEISPPAPTRLIVAAATFTATPSPTPIPASTATATPSPTPTPLPSPTPTPTTPTPTETSPPPTATPPPAPTPTPVPPTPTSPPSFPFTIVETAQFPTNHANFDVYIAITDSDNRPLPGYTVRGIHSAGLQIDSQPSAHDWTVNSGAMHYKAGNIKYEAPNSPTGIWTLQLVNDNNQPVAPPVEFQFDTTNPTWYFLIYRQESG